jgi:hypothetical protein
MNSNSNKKTIVGLLTLAVVLLATIGNGQDRYAQNGNSTISISGTSTLHAWTMSSKEAVYDAVFETNDKKEPVKLISLLLTLPAESLKSGKSAMDKNAYNALKTDAHKQITFQLTSARIEGNTIRCNGKLKIAGVTKQVELEASYTTLPGGKIQCKGSKAIVMTDYGVEPPSFMFGSVTTGNEITVTFDVVLSSEKQQSLSLN